MSATIDGPVAATEVPLAGKPPADIRRGKSFPLGATLTGDGGNFSVFAKHSTGAQLLLFDDVNAPNPSRVIDLDPRANRTYHYWHVFVPGVTAGSMPTAFLGRLILRGGCASMPTRCYSTLTESVSRARPGAVCEPHDSRGTMLPPH